MIYHVVGIVSVLAALVLLVDVDADKYGKEDSAEDAVAAEDGNRA